MHDGVDFLNVYCTDTLWRILLKNSEVVAADVNSETEVGKTSYGAVR